MFSVNWTSFLLLLANADPNWISNWKVGIVPSVTKVGHILTETTDNQAVQRTKPATASFSCGATALDIAPNGEFVVVNSFPSGALGPLAFTSGGRGTLVAWPRNSLTFWTQDLDSTYSQTSFISPSSLLAITPFRSPPRVYNLNLGEKKIEIGSADPRFSRLENMPGYWRVFYANIGSFVDQSTWHSFSQMLNSFPVSTRANFRPSPNLDGLVSLTQTKKNYLLLGSEDLGKLLVAQVNNADIQTFPVDNRIDQLGFPDLSFTMDANNNLVLKDIGLLSSIESKIFEAKDLPMYSQILTNSFDSTLSTTFSPNKIFEITTEDHVANEVLKVELSKWTEAGWYLHAGSRDTASGRTVLLMKGASSEDTSLVFLERKGATRYLLCDAAQTNRPASSPTHNENPTGILSPKFRMTFEEVGAQTSKIGIWSIFPSGPIKGSVVSIRGGPTETVRGQELSILEEGLLERGLKIIRVEYSGAKQSSPYLYSRLKINITDALNSDAYTLIQYLKAENNSGPRILLAYSFGALLGGQILKQDKDLFERSVLISPMGTWQPVNDVVGSERQTMTKLRRNFQNLSFGAPLSIEVDDPKVLEFTQTVQRLVSPFCGAEGVSVYFGRYDTVTPPSTWNPNCSESNTRIIISDAAHGLSPGMRLRVLADLDTSLSEIKRSRRLSDSRPRR